MKSLFTKTLIYFNLLYIPIPSNFNLLKYTLIILLLFSLLKSSRNLNLKKFKNINLSVFTFITSICISSILCYWDFDIKRQIPLISPNTGITFSIIVLLSFWFIEYIIINKLEQKFISYLSKILNIYILVIDIYIITHLSTPYTEASTIYLIGDKFQITYLHFLWCTIYYFKNYNKVSASFKIKIYLITYLFITLCITKLVYCSTGILGTLILCILFLFPKIFNCIIKHPIVPIIFFILCSLFVVYVEYLLTIPSIQHLITNILQEDLTLTGRTVIYSSLLDIIMIKPLFGYGYGNSSFIVTHYVGFGNAQNAILDNIINYGCIGVLAFFLLIYRSLKQTSGISSIFPFLALIYVYIIIGTVEISLGLNFISIIPLLLLSNNYQTTHEKTCINTSSYLRS